LSRDERRRDDYVHDLRLIREELHLRVDEGLRHLLRVPALTFAALVDVDVEELAAEALHLPPRPPPAPRVEGRTSNAFAWAPSPCAVAIAARPATPAPMTSTCAGGALPA